MVASSDSFAVRERIAALEKELLEKQQTLSGLRRALPPEPVDDYELEGSAGPLKLSELFGEKSDLILIHNMGKGCSYCTLWADGFNGEVDHLQDRAAFVVCSPDPPDLQAAFAASRGWRFPMVSNGGSTFTEDMGYVGEWNGKTSPWPGVSTFRKKDDGSIVRIAHCPLGPGDPFCAVWHLFALLDGGTGEWQPRYSYGNAS